MCSKLSGILILIATRVRSDNIMKNIARLGNRVHKGKNRVDEK